MECIAYVLYRIRGEEDRRRGDLGAFLGAKQLKMSAHEVTYPRSLPVLPQHQFLGLSEAFQALIEPCHKLVNAANLLGGLQRHALDHR